MPSRCVHLASLLAAGLFATLAAHATAPSFDAAVQLYDRRELAAARVAFTQLAAVGAPRSDYFLGKIALREHHYDRAVELLARATAAAPTDDDAWHWLGNAHAWVAATTTSFPRRAQHARQSLTAYERAVALNPDSVPARLSLINLQRHLPAFFGGGLRRARAQADEVARRDPLRGAYARALLLAHEKDYAAALAVLGPLRREHPEFYPAHLLVGYIATRSGLAREEARTALHRCLALTPGEFDEPHDVARDLLAQLDAPPGAEKRDERVTAR